MPYDPFNPETQIAFASRLRELGPMYFSGALRETVSKLDVAMVEREYAAQLTAEQLALIAGFGLRAEAVFPSVSILKANPRLLGYYRLLYGLSQKEFYRRFGRFKSMEDRSTLTPNVAAELPRLCESLCQTAWILLTNLTEPSPDMLRDLQLLTLGPQLRGARLNEIGRAAVEIVFFRIRSAVDDSIVESEGAREIVLRNAAGLVCTVSFASDPDIAIRQALATGVRNVLAVEVKGGADVSNIHNRLGEAEKSHRKAKDDGFTECWTIVNAAVPPKQAKLESPTTDRFFNLSEIIDPTHAQWAEFRDGLSSRLGT